MYRKRFALQHVDRGCGHNLTLARTFQKSEERGKVCVVADRLAVATSWNSIRSAAGTPPQPCLTQPLWTSPLFCFCWAFLLGSRGRQKRGLHRGLPTPMLHAGSPSKIVSTSTSALHSQNHPTSPLHNTVPTTPYRTIITFFEKLLFDRNIFDLHSFWEHQ